MKSNQAMIVKDQLVPKDGVYPKVRKKALDFSCLLCLYVVG